MPGPLLLRRDSDPEGKGRGPGYYYHRGKGIYSKYNRFRDALIKRGPYRIGGGPYKHTMDYKAIQNAPSYPTNVSGYPHKKSRTVLQRMKRIRWKNGG